MSQSDFLSLINIIAGTITVSSLGKILEYLAVLQVYILGLIWFYGFTLLCLNDMLGWFLFE